MVLTGIFCILWALNGFDWYILLLVNSKTKQRERKNKTDDFVIFKDEYWLMCNISYNTFYSRRGGGGEVVGW